jgi:uncharacterized protein (AIM24 family)
LQKLTGPGVVFLEFDGSIVEKEILPGKPLKVDTGHLGAFTVGVDYDIERVKGFKNMFFGGEGLFLTTLTGKGKVWLQSMPLANVADRLKPFMPVSHDD